jgi:hypothetical protein
MMVVRRRMVIVIVIVIYLRSINPSLGYNPVDIDIVTYMLSNIRYIVSE